MGSSTPPAGGALDMRGIDRKGDRWRLRMRFADGRYAAVVDTLDEAIALRAEWRRRRDANETPEMESTYTLRSGATELLSRKRTEVSTRTKRRLSPRGVEWWARVLLPCIEGEFADIPVDLLNPVKVAAADRKRAAKRAKSAADERVARIAVLRLLRAEGAKFDDRLLEAPVIAREVRERRALSPGELELLAWSAPDYATRAILFAGKTGLRWTELVTLTRDRVDLDEGWVHIPRELTKERAKGGKYVDLFDDEIALLREQLSPIRDADASPTAALPPSPASSPLVFPARDGGQYAHHQFLRLVWYKARARAAATWRADRGIADPMAPTPFTWVGEDGRLTGITPHDLRSTAVSDMVRRGMSEASAAVRIGHADGGKLVREVYAKVDRRKLARDEMARVDEREGRASTPAGSPSSTTRKGI